jgi:hypothetical protein
MRIERTSTLLFAVTSVLAVMATGALADDLNIPPRKAGQWEVTMALGKGMPEMKVQMCLDETTDKSMMAAGLSMTKKNCPTQNMSRDGDDIVIDSVCDFGGMKTTSHIVISGDMQSDYTVHITGDVEGGPKGMPGKTDMTQTVHWVGADCDGMKPGEMMMPGGSKIDATQMMKAMGG